MRQCLSNRYNLEATGNDYELGTPVALTAPAHTYDLEAPSVVNAYDLEVAPANAYDLSWKQPKGTRLPFRPHASYHP